MNADAAKPIGGPLASAVEKRFLTNAIRFAEWDK